MVLGKKKKFSCDVVGLNYQDFPGKSKQPVTYHLPISDTNRLIRRVRNTELIDVIMPSRLRKEFDVRNQVRTKRPKRFARNSH